MTRRRRRPRRDIGFALVVALTACALLVPAGFWLFGRDERLPTYGPSMYPTLRGEADLEVDYHAYDAAPPRVGDIVVFQGPAHLDEDGTCAGRIPVSAPCGMAADSYGEDYLVKRIVAGPGDSLAIAPDGRAIVNGRTLAEPYIRRCDAGHTCELSRPVRVPRDHFFMLGDNRPESSDSRDWGPVHVDAIDGRVVIDD